LEQSKSRENDYLVAQWLAFDSYGAEPGPGERGHRLVALEYFPRRDTLLLVRTQALLFVIAVSKLLILFPFKKERDRERKFSKSNIQTKKTMNEVKKSN